MLNSLNSGLKWVNRKQLVEFHWKANHQQKSWDNNKSKETICERDTEKSTSCNYAQVNS